MSQKDTTNSERESGSSSIGLLGSREIRGVPDEWDFKIGRSVHVGGWVAMAKDGARWIAYGHHPSFTATGATEAGAIARHLMLRFSEPNVKVDTRDSSRCVSRLVRLLGLNTSESPHVNIGGDACEFSSVERSLKSTLATLEGHLSSERRHDNLAFRTVNVSQGYDSINAVEKDSPMLNKILGDDVLRNELFKLVNLLTKQGILFLQLRDFLLSYAELFFDERQVLSKDSGAPMFLDKSFKRFSKFREVEHSDISEANSKDNPSEGSD